MKFVEIVSNAGRSGILSEFSAQWKNETFRTPMFMTFTRAGTVPHLTFDSLRRLEDQKIFMVQTLPTVVDFENAVKEQARGLGTFVGLPEFPFHVSMQDPGTATPLGFNVKKGVSVWTNGGKRLLRVNEFMDIIKAFRPVSYQVICDSDTHVTCSKKRITKAVDHSLAFLDECLEIHAGCEELKDSAVFGTIQGGYDVFMRKRSAEQTSKRAVDGFVIDGFHLNGPHVKDLNFETVKSILKETIQCLPSEKPRIFHGALHPDNILEAIGCGIDIFDSSYAYILTERGLVSTYPLESVNQFFKLEPLEDPIKRSKQNYELDLTDKIFADDFKPLLNDCLCYTCKHYTRAYVNHLLVTSELLAYILLMMHNMHHFSRIFERIREVLDIKNEKRNHILNQ